MDTKNIWLKEIELSDGNQYCDLLMELANYKDVYARPVPSDFTYDDFAYFKAARIRMSQGENLPENIMPTSTYWVMDNDVPVGYATLKHRIDENKPGGHFGLCLKKEYQNQGLGCVVADCLSIIAYENFGMERVIFTSKNENIQSQKSVENIGAELISVHDGYHFYELDLRKKVNEIKEGRFK